MVEYRDIPGHAGYRVGSDGSDGSVWSSFRGEWRRLATHTGKLGYLRVWLGRKAHCYVHRLVLEAFVGPCPEGLQGCHFPDPDRNNNAASNLRWASRESNEADKEVHGTKIRGEKAFGAKLTETIVKQLREDARQSGFDVALAAKHYGVWPRTIESAIRGESWSHVR